jgi:hypothetical protein
MARLARAEVFDPSEVAVLHLCARVVRRCFLFGVGTRANQEDKQVGKFFQGRYRAVRILDEESLLACAAYVDLNPIRAALAKTLESSQYTSVQRRIQALEQAASSPASQGKSVDSFLSPLTIDEQ